MPVPSVRYGFGFTTMNYNDAYDALSGANSAGVVSPSLTPEQRKLLDRRNALDERKSKLIDSVIGMFDRTTKPEIQAIREECAATGHAFYRHAGVSRKTGSWTYTCNICGFHKED